eukprot:5977725-Alexandrium_andersonii.AAC.1
MDFLTRSRSRWKSTFWEGLGMDIWAMCNSRKKHTGISRGLQLPSHEGRPQGMGLAQVGQPAMARGGQVEGLLEAARSHDGHHGLREAGARLVGVGRLEQVDARPRRGS